MENMSLILIIFVIGVVTGALLIGGRQRRYDDYYYTRFYPPPMPHHGYRDRQYGSGIFLFVLIVISIFALILFFEDSDVSPLEPAMPAKYGSLISTGTKPVKVTLRTCYLELGRYPTWESGSDAQRKLSVAYQQSFDLVNRQSAGSDYHLVIGPFHGPKAAEAHMERYGLRAKVVYFD